MEDLCDTSHQFLPKVIICLNVLQQYDAVMMAAIKLILLTIYFHGCDIVNTSGYGFHTQTMKILKMIPAQPKQ